MPRGARLFPALLLLATTAAQGQEDIHIDARVNYVYAAQFGFGQYRVGGLRVNVYTLPIQFSFRDVLGDADLRVGTPVVYGNYRFSTTESFGGQTFTVNAETNSIAIEPKVMLDVPIFEGFRLSPLAALGIGSTFDTKGQIVVGEDQGTFETPEDAFYTFQVGLSSLYRHRWGKFTGYLGNAIIYAGDHSLGGVETAEDYGTLRTGVEARHPLGFEVGRVVPDAGLHFVYSYFFPSLEFTRAGRASLEVDQLFEVGVTVGTTTSLDLPWLGDILDDVRLGVSYQTGDGLDGIRLTTGFPF